MESGRAVAETRRYFCWSAPSTLVKNIKFEIFRWGMMGQDSLPACNARCAVVKVQARVREDEISLINADRYYLEPIASLTS